MAAFSNLLKLDRLIRAVKGLANLRDAELKPQTSGFDDVELQAEYAFVSERGMILIGCFIFCLLVWSTALFWIFG